MVATVARATAPGTRSLSFFDSILRLLNLNGVGALFPRRALRQ